VANVYEHVVTRGAVRLRRRWEADETSAPTRRGGGTNAGQPGRSTAGRVQAVFSARSRRAMRYEFVALPWELLGARPAMVTLTYPATWRPWCVDARQLVRHREALKERWRRRYGAPVGVWVVEFQPRKRRAASEQHAPHLHLYVGLPEAMSDDEYAGLRARMFGRRALERQFGKYEGRGKVKPPEGEFSEWLLRSWWEVVGSGQPSHRKRGADVTPLFWSDTNRVKVAQYLWRESGKWGQKTPPEGFGGLSFYGRWGGRTGFVPLEGCNEIDRRVFDVLRRYYWRYAAKAQARDAVAMGLKPRKFKRPRGHDGLTAFTPDGVGFGMRMEEWAVGHVLSRMAEA